MGKPAGFATDIWIEGNRWRIDVSASFIAAATGIADPSDRDMLDFLAAQEQRVRLAATAKIAGLPVSGQPIQLGDGDLAP